MAPLSGTKATVFPGFPKPTDLKWQERRVTQGQTAKLMWQAMQDALGQVGEQINRVYVSPIDGLAAIVAWAPGYGWHLSISHAERYPTWNEIRDARYALLPDGCTMGMLLPPKADYVNVHPNCFHLHEVTDEA